MMVPSSAQHGAHRSKAAILGTKDSFSKQPLFQAAWQALYPGLLEWSRPRRPAERGRCRDPDAPSGGGRVPTFGGQRHPAADGAQVGLRAGLADAYGWCRIDPVTFESSRIAKIDVIGDASAAGAMPKSAFSAAVQAKVCAGAVADLLAGRQPVAPKLITVCHSLAAPDCGLSIAGVYQPERDQLVNVLGSGGLSPDDAALTRRAREASLGRAWFGSIAKSLFG